jgi:hypothetical protein
MAQATKKPPKSKAKAKAPAKPRAKTNSRSAQSKNAQSKNGAGSVKDTAVGRTKAAGHAIADAASKAKTPLIAGGTALAGVAVGAVVKDRVDSSKGPIKRLRSSSMASSAKNLGKVDPGTVKSVADRVTTYGQRASDIAAAVEKTRKKNK